MTWFNFLRWAIDLVWLGLLAFLFSHFWRVRSALVQAKSWLKVKGHIISCELIRVGHSAWPEIQYSYQVYDKNLVGEYLFLDTSHNNPNSRYSRMVAYKVVLAFKENSAIDVYYNPNHPEQSALDVTIPAKLNLILILIGALFILHLGVMGLRFLG